MQNIETWKHRNMETHTHTDAHADSGEYLIVAFCTNATIISSCPHVIFFKCDYHNIFAIFSEHTAALNIFKKSDQVVFELCME